MIATHELRNLLRAKYPRDQYAFFEELPDATGGLKQRTADAFCISLWPSRGLWTAGFELKVSRADWQKELKQPRKAERFFNYCDYWWLVVGDKSIVHPGELPETWGMLALVGGKLKVIVEAPKNEALAMPRPFLASLLRQAQEQLNPQRELDRARQQGFEEGRAAGGKWKQYEVDNLQRKITAFEDAAGVKLDTWNAGSLAEAYRLVRENRIDSHTAVLRDLRDRAQKIVETIGNLEGTDNV
jgi:hypothetical protein